MNIGHLSTRLFSLPEYVQLHMDGTFEQECYSYLIIWVRDGRSSGTDRGSVYCLQKSNYRALQNLADREGYVISFPVYYFNNFKAAGLGAFFDDPFQVLMFEVGEDCSSILRLLWLEFIREADRTAPNPWKEEIIKSLLKIFIIRLSYESSSIVPTREAGDVQFANRFFELIELHFLKTKRVCQYSAMMAVSSNYLNQKIKQITGFPASHHIRRRVVIEARQLAEQRRLCAKEIAYELGFSDSSHFSKAFKNLVGVTFKDYQQKHGQWIAEPHR